MPSRPEWWKWPLELSPHLLKRMIDRQFNESDLRSTLEDATAWGIDVEPGRQVVTTRHERRSWEVIVEPIPSQQVLLVITAYPLE